MADDMSAYIDMDSDGGLMSSDDSESKDLFGALGDLDGKNIEKRSSEPVRNDDLLDDDDEDDDDDDEDEDDVVPVSIDRGHAAPRHGRSLRSKMTRRQERHMQQQEPEPAEPEPEVDQELVDDDEDENDVVAYDDTESDVQPIVGLSNDDDEDDDEDDDKDDIVETEDDGEQAVNSPIRRSVAKQKRPDMADGVDFDLIRKIIYAYTYCSHFKKKQIDTTYEFMKVITAVKRIHFYSTTDSSDSNDLKMAAIIKAAIDLDDDVRQSVHNLITAKNMDDSDRAFFLVGLEDRKKLDAIYLILRIFNVVPNQDLPADASFNQLAKMLDKYIKSNLKASSGVEEMISTIDELLMKTDDISGDSSDEETD